jgi:hypothetical protein
MLIDRNTLLQQDLLRKIYHQASSQRKAYLDVNGTQAMPEGITALPTYS